MEPASAIIGIASGAAGLVALTAQVVTYLVGLRDTYRNTELTILDLVSTCQAYQTAWSQVEQWASQRIDHQQSQESQSVLLELTAFLDSGKIMMNLIQKDVDRNLLKSRIWHRNSTRSRSTGAIRLTLHQKVVLEHADRIHRQNTSLNLLLSILNLPSRTLQEATIEVLRLKFRKDEETTWTIVNTKPSATSHRWSTSLASCCNSTSSPTPSIAVNHHSRKGCVITSFSFEDDLFSGPVYKRLLISRLCERPAKTTTTTNSILRRHATSRIDTSCDPTDAAMSIVTRPLNLKERAINDQDDTLALELRRKGIFSRSVHEDFCEFMESHRPRRMQRRHLPLASVLLQQDMNVDEQMYVNRIFFEYVRQRDLRNVARALDAGADVNFHVNGQTALDFCIKQWLDSKAAEPDLPSEHTTMAEFLMIYKETCVSYKSTPSTTILHLCMHIGATAEFMKPFFAIEGQEKALKQLDKFGRTVLHTAVLSSESGLFALTELKKLFGAGSILTKQIVDAEGANPLALATSIEAYDHLAVLIELRESSADDKSRPQGIFVANP